MGSSDRSAVAPWSAGGISILPRALQPGIRSQHDAVHAKSALFSFSVKRNGGVGVAVGQLMEGARWGAGGRTRMKHLDRRKIWTSIGTSNCNLSHLHYIATSNADVQVVVGNGCESQRDPVGRCEELIPG